MNMKKSEEKGISLIILVITVTIMLVLSGIIIYNSKDYAKQKALNMMCSDIAVLKESVETYYLKYNVLPLADEADGEEIVAKLGTQRNPRDDTDRYYYINISALENLTLSTNEQDEYVINAKTHEIYSITGVIMGNKRYYREPGNEIEEVD